MTRNVGSVDRITRTTVGIMMMALGLSRTVGGALGVALVMLGATLLVTGTVGHCPLYRALGLSTVRPESGSATSP
jgi:hypothetical protein